MCNRLFHENVYKILKAIQLSKKLLLNMAVDFNTETNNFVSFKRRNSVHYTYDKYTCLASLLKKNCHGFPRLNCSPDPS